MSDIQVIPNALNSFIGKEVLVSLYGEHTFVSLRGELDAVVGDGNYIVRAKRDDVTVRFSKYKLDGITFSGNTPVIYVLVDQQPRLGGQL